MNFAVYNDVTTGIATYHRMGMGDVETGRTESGWWEHDLPDRESIFKRSMQVPRIKAVLPCDRCFPFSTDAKCVGCM